MTGRWHIFLGALLLLWASAVWAQQQLVVNGQAVAGLTTSLVPGSSYVPAQALADALGAQVVYDASANILTLDLAGNFLTLGVYGGPAAMPPEGALVLNGEGVPGGGAVARDGVVYVPVKPVAAAFDGAVSYLADQQTVVVVSPRTTLQRARLEPQGEGERFVLDFSAATAFEPTFNAALGTLQIRFDRADASAKQFSGNTFTRAGVTPNAGHLDFRVTLKPGYGYQTFTSPNGNGFSFVVDIVPQRADRPTEKVVVIDPGHGGQDPGMSLSGGNEAGLTLSFAQQLADALRAQGLESRLTRTEGVTLGAGLRSQQGIGSDLFVSVHAADLLPGQYNLYYLGEVPDSPTLEAAVRENARAALEGGADTDALRRRVLLNLIPDLAKGVAYSQTLERDLTGAGYRANSVQAAPLAVLDGAAGRGLLLELSPEDLRDDAFAQTLAASLAAMLNRGTLD